MKIGIFGGSFNPPHKMHKKVALELIRKKYVDKVIFVPTGGKYPKKGLIDGSYRYEMVKKMIDGISKLEVSDYELKDNLVFTFQTLTYFQKQYLNDEIYFICGTDNLKELDTWKNYQDILMNFKLLIIKRNLDNLEDILKKYEKYQERMIICNFKIESISSTEIRRMLKSGQMSKEIDFYLEKEVIQYIDKNHLYDRKEEKNG